jgi:hypothetical protein
MFANGICAFHIVFGIVTAYMYIALEPDGGSEKHEKGANDTQCKLLKKNKEYKTKINGTEKFLPISDRYTDALKWLMISHACCAASLLFSIMMRTCCRKVYVY